jgi:hypothetical protein
MYKEAKAISGSLTNLDIPDDLPQQVLNCTLGLLKNIINPPGLNLF